MSESLPSSLWRRQAVYKTNRCNILHSSGSFDDRAVRAANSFCNAFWIVLMFLRCKLVPKKVVLVILLKKSRKRVLVSNASDDEYWGAQCLWAKKLWQLVLIVLILKNEYPDQGQYEVVHVQESFKILC
jgi:hypothetical protein